MPDIHLHTPLEVAVAAGIPRAEIYQAIAEGRLPAVRVGRSVRISAEAAERFIQAVAGESEPGE